DAITRKNLLGLVLMYLHISSFRLSGRTNPVQTAYFIGSGEMVSMTRESTAGIYHPGGETFQKRFKAGQMLRRELVFLSCAFQGFVEASQPDLARRLIDHKW